jgi:dynein intermediate chain
MSDKRRAEIEAKRAKLAELRKARADRQRAETERRQTEPGPSSIARRDVDDLVNQLVGSRGGLDTGGDVTPSSSLPNTPPRPSTNLLHGSALSPSGRVSRQSDVGSDRDRVSMGTTMVGMMEHVDRVLTPRFIPDLIDVEQELFELPQRERVIYNKEVQTTAIETETPQVSEDEIRQQIMRERELEAERIAQDKELEEESVQLEKEIEQEIRELTEEERSHILSAPEFLDFVEQSSKILQRALNDGYDYIRDYTIGTEANGDDSEGKRVKRICAFYDERYGKNRSITDVDWSPKYPELSVASYNKNPAALNEPDGIVAYGISIYSIDPSSCSTPSLMSSPSRSLHSTRTWCLVARTRGRFFCGIRARSIYLCSRRPFRLLVIHTLCMRCKWSALRTRTT